MRFFDAHSLFSATQQPTWRTVVGGSSQYVRKLLARYRGELRLGRTVRALRRHDDGE
jgi:predicted NAD/FAD-binding protein